MKLEPYIDMIKAKVDAGKLTKAEAVYLILGKVASMVEHATPIDKKQFMKDRAFEARNWN